MLRKLGGIGVLATTFLVVYFPTKSVALGVLAALVWFLLPWFEIVTRIRRLRLPLEKRVRSRMAPSTARFPYLDQFTTELEDAGFEHVEDTGWEWEDLSQFFRLFYHPEDRTQAAICLSEQSHLAFFYLSLSSRTENDRTFTTWNYPFSYTIKLAPKVRANRVLDVQSFEELLVCHQDFLLRNQVASGEIQPLDEEDFTGQLEKDMREQIDHNMNIGVLLPSENGTFRYSWRGCIFLWLQSLKDLVRMY